MENFKIVTFTNNLKKDLYTLIYFCVCAMKHNLQNDIIINLGTEDYRIFCEKTSGGYYKDKEFKVLFELLKNFNIKLRDDFLFTEKQVKMKKFYRVWIDKIKTIFYYDYGCDSILYVDTDCMLNDNITSIYNMFNDFYNKIKVFNWFSPSGYLNIEKYDNIDFFWINSCTIFIKNKKDINKTEILNYFLINKNKVSDFVFKILHERPGIDLFKYYWAEEVTISLFFSKFLHKNNIKTTEWLDLINKSFFENNYIIMFSESSMFIECLNYFNDNFHKSRIYHCLCKDVLKHKAIEYLNNFNK